MNKNLPNRIFSFVLGTLGFAAALWLKRSKITRWVVIPGILILVGVSTFLYYNSIKETPYSFAAGAFVQAKSGQENNVASSLALTFNSTTTAGNMIIVTISSYQAGGDPAITLSNNAGFTFTAIQTATTTINSGYLYMWYAKNIPATSSPATITATADATAYITMSISEYSGLDTTEPLEASTGNRASIQNLTTNSLTSAAAGNVFFATLTEDPGLTSTPGNGFTELDDIQTGQDLHTEYLQASTATTTSAVFNLSSSATLVYLYATFKAAPAASYTLDQSAYRFRNDDGNETTATWAAAENATSTFPLATNQRLRAQVNASGTPPAIPFQLEWQKNGGAWNEATTGPLSLITPTFVATGTTVSGTGAVTPGVPSGYAADDLLLIFTESANEAVSNPTGYSQAVAIGTGTAAGASSTRLTVMYKFASASESAPTVADPGNHVLAFMMAIRGVDKTNPFNATSTNADTGNNRSVNITGTTTSVSNALVIAATTNVTDTATAQYSNWTNASLTSLTPRYNAGTTQGNGGGIGMATGILASPGSTGNTTATTVTATLKTSATLVLAPVAVPDMIIASSPNIVAGAASSTTAQLTAPSPKTTSSFFAGRISEDTNPLPSLTITPNYYTELEWNLQATSTSANGDIFNFRVTNNGTVLDTYSYTPVWIIGSNSPPASSSSTPIFLQFE